MKLTDAITSVRSISDDLCIVAKRPWEPDSESELITLTADGRVPMEYKERGFDYFLEADIIRRELLDFFPPNLTSHQIVSAVIHYAEFDATPQWLNDLLRQNAIALDSPSDTPTTPASDDKFQAAVEHAGAIQAILRQLPGQPWVGYFDRLVAALSAGDVEATVRARDAVPYAGMGAFGDFLETHPQITPHWNAVSRIIGVLKVHARYGDPR